MQIIRPCAICGHSPVINRNKPCEGFYEIVCLNCMRGDPLGIGTFAVAGPSLFDVVKGWNRQMIELKRT